MTTYVLEPTDDTYTDGEYAQLGTWAATGGTMPDVLTDDSPAIGATGGTYVKKTSDNIFDYYAVDVGTVSIPSDEAVTQVRAGCHYLGPGYARAVTLGQIREGGFKSPTSWSSSPSEDTTTRVIYGAWHTAPLKGGPAWTQNDIDELLVVVRDYGPASSPAEFSKAWVEVVTTTALTLNSLEVVGGDPVTTTTRPSIAWGVGGGVLTRTEAHVYTQAQYEAPGFAPGVSPSITLGASAYPSGLTGTVHEPLTDGVTYRAYVRIAKTVNGEYLWSDWDYEEFTVSVAAPAAPSLNAEWDTALQRATISVGSGVNLLTANQSTLDTDTTGWVTAGSNCTAARSNTTGLVGDWSLRLTSTAAGSMSTTTLTGTDGIPVTPGVFYTVAAAARETTGTAIWGYVGICFYDAAGDPIGAAHVGREVSLLQSPWLWATHTAQAPEGAAFAALLVGACDTDASDRRVYYDSLLFAPIPAATVTQHNKVANCGGVHDAGGWATTSTTLTRSTSYTATGRSSLKSVSASTNSSISDTFPATAGTVYTFAALALRDGSSTTGTVGVLFLDADDNEIGDWVTGTLPFDNGVFGLGVVTATAPDGAVAVTVRVKFPAVAPVTSYVDAVALFEGAHAPESVSDYLTNYYTPGAFSTAVRKNKEDNPSFETSDSGWTSAAGSTNATSVLHPIEGTKSWEVYRSSAGPAAIDTSLTSSRVTPGYALTAAIVATGKATPRDVQIVMEAYTDGDVLISRQEGAQVTTSLTGPVLLTVSWAPPATVDYVKVLVESVNDDFEHLDGFYLDAAAILDGAHEPDSVADYLANYYIDGDRAGAWWAGTAHAAQSVGGVVSLTAGASTPTVELEVSDDAGVTWGPVRLGVLDTVDGLESGVFTDAESPRGGVLQFRARASVEYEPGETVTGDWCPVQEITATSDGQWWIVNPADSSMYAGRVRITANPDETRFEDNDVLRPLGTGFPVVLSGPLGGLDGSYDFEATDDWEQLLPLIDYQGTLLVRSAFGDQKYVRITDRSWSRHGTPGNERRKGQLGYVEVVRP